MSDQFIRTSLTFGKAAIEKLHKSRVIVFGIGGVGGHVVEALVRSGIGAIDIVDDDVVCLSNLNRQILALHSTLGKAKVDVAEQRILDINPDCKVTKHKTFFLPENSSQFDFSKYDYVVDCIDTVSGKIEIIMKSKEAGVPVISCMGAGNKIDPSLLQIADIYKTSVCPLARVMRNEMKKRRVKHLKCLFSTEKVIPPELDLLKNEEGEPQPQTRTDGKKSFKKQTPGSNAFVPSVAGLMIAGEIIRDLAGKN